MAEYCPCCHQRVPEGETSEYLASRNDRHDAIVRVEEENIRAVIGALRDAHNNTIFHNNRDLCSRLASVLAQLRAATPEALRIFGGNNWARALEGVEKGYDVRVITRPSTDPFTKEEMKNRLTVDLTLFTDGEPDQVLASGDPYDPQMAIDGAKAAEEAFARFRPMAE